jgi:hypothetical protein
MLPGARNGGRSSSLKAGNVDRRDGRRVALPIVLVNQLPVPVRRVDRLSMREGCRPIRNPTLIGRRRGPVVA